MKASRQAGLLQGIEQLVDGDLQPLLTQLMLGNQLFLLNYYAWAAAPNRACRLASSGNSLASGGSDARLGYASNTSLSSLAVNERIDTAPFAMPRLLATKTQPAGSVEAEKPAARATRACVNSASIFTLVSAPSLHDTKVRPSRSRIKIYPHWASAYAGGSRHMAPWFDNNFVSTSVCPCAALISAASILPLATQSTSRTRSVQRMSRAIPGRSCKDACATRCTNPADKTGIAPTASVPRHNVRISWASRRISSTPVYTRSTSRYKLRPTWA